MSAPPAAFIAERVEQLNVALAGSPTGGGRWWSYTVSHQEFELLIGDPAGQGNVVIKLAACHELSGPTTWPVQNLKASVVSVESGFQFEVRDSAVGFLARARMLSWKANHNLLGHLSKTE